MTMMTINHMPHMHVLTAQIPIAMLFGGALKGPASKVPELACGRIEASLQGALVGDVYHLVGGLEHELYFPFHRKGMSSSH